MALVNYTYVKSSEPLGDEWFDELGTIRREVDWADNIYWITASHLRDPVDILIQASKDMRLYRCVYRDRTSINPISKRADGSPNPSWLNPEAIVQRGVEPLPFSWRS